MFWLKEITTKKRNIFIKSLQHNIFFVKEIVESLLSTVDENPTSPLLRLPHTTSHRNSYECNNRNGQQSLFLWCAFGPMKTLLIQFTEKESIIETTKLPRSIYLKEIKKIEMDDYI